MNGVKGFKRLVLLATFKRDYKRLDAQQQAAVDECLRDLQRDVIPQVRRWHKVDRTARPPIFTVDVFPNHSYKVSCHVDNDTQGEYLVLRRVAPHKTIDRAP